MNQSLPDRNGDDLCISNQLYPSGSPIPMKAKSRLDLIFCLKPGIISLLLGQQNISLPMEMK